MVLIENTRHGNTSKNSLTIAIFKNHRKFSHSKKLEPQPEYQIRVLDIGESAVSLIVCVCVFLTIEKRKEEARTSITP